MKNGTPHHTALPDQPATQGNKSENHERRGKADHLRVPHWLRKIPNQGCAKDGFRFLGENVLEMDKSVV